MKKGIFFQIVIITVILLVWNVLHLGYQYQKNLLERQLSRIPMILISPELSSLQSLRSEIDSLNFIQNISIEPDSLIARNLMDHYQIAEAEFLLKDFHLPSVMRIFFYGSGFSGAAKMQLENLIQENYDQIIINYDNNFWLQSDRKILLLQKSYLFGNGFLALFLLITMIFLRLFYEAKHHEFWRIYRNSGGKRQKRRRQFFINSLLLCLLPILLNFGAYFALRYFNYLFLEIDYRFFAGEFGVVVFSVLLSRLFLGSQI